MWSSVGIKVLCDYLKSGFALSTVLKYVVCWAQGIMYILLCYKNLLQSKWRIVVIRF